MNLNTAFPDPTTLPDISDLPSRLKFIREALKEKQADIAKRLGISTRAWQVYERGTSKPGFDVIEALAEIGVDPTWLVTGRHKSQRNHERIDTDVLQDCLRVLSEEMKERNISLTPSQQSEAVSILYELCIPKNGEEKRPIEKGVVVRLLKLAS